MGQTDRMNVTIWTKEALSKPLVIFDTETAGLYEDAEIVEISCISGDGEVLLDTLVNPNRSVPYDDYRIHRICDADMVTVRMAPTLAPTSTPTPEPTRRTPRRRGGGGGGYAPPVATATGHADAGPEHARADDSADAHADSRADDCGDGDSDA